MCTKFGEFTLKFNEVAVFLVHLLTMHTSLGTGYQSNCGDFMKQDEWLPKSPNHNLLNCHV